MNQYQLLLIIFDRVNRKYGMVVILLVRTDRYIIEFEIWKHWNEEHFEFKCAD